MFYYHWVNWTCLSLSLSLSPLRSFGGVIAVSRPFPRPPRVYQEILGHSVMIVIIEYRVVKTALGCQNQINKRITTVLISLS